VSDHEITPEVADQIKDRFGTGAHFAFIAPAVTRTRLQHIAGIPDEARGEAEARIDSSVPALEDAGLEPEPAAVGDQDPVIAIEDAIREFPDLEEVILVTHIGEAERMAEKDAFDRIRQRVAIPVTLLEVDASGALVDTERSDPGKDESENIEVEGDGRNMQPFSLQDFLAVIVAIVGTIVLLIIAAVDISDATNPGAGLEVGSLITVLLALSFFLVNVWHVVAIFMFESVGYRGFAAKTFAAISLVGTPLAMVVSLLVSP
jgi:hypothetical protein